MSSRTFRIATVGGVDVRVAPSWLLIAVAIVWTYRASFIADGRSMAVAVGMALAAAVLFSASVLVHELAHALEGLHRGAEVEGITLFLLGGATAMRDGDRRAVDELAIAAIGPWSNIVLASLFGLLATSANTVAAVDLGAVADVAGLLGWLNLGLAAFNLVPGAPLDGGRMLRAGLWFVTGNRNRSAIAAAWAGLALAGLLLLWAAWLIAVQPGAIISGLWVALIGAYILRAARLELVRARLSSWLARHTAGSLAPPLPQPGSESEPESGSASGSPPGPLTASELEALPVIAADAPADALANLLDPDQPYVILEDGATRWVSSLALIDAAIVARRREASS